MESGSQSRCGGEDKKVPFTGIEAWSSSSSFVTVPSELSRHCTKRIN